MRLSQIKMAGFKSFVDPVTLRFPSDLAGVVGPNGCGKSNIIDAVRWVMGESSRHLRGDSMEDVIFNGSSARKPVGQASIELIFDNSDGQVGGQYAQYAEIAVRRSFARDGQSRYFLNGANCRRRDVADIFLGTGLGPRSYAIIEQGMVSRLIEARPEELRVYLEEAAGISKYKERRRETEGRMRHARDNLARLDDLREDLQKQINHLQRQAEMARRYQTLKKQARKAKANLLALRWREQAQDARERERALEISRTRHENALGELRAVEARIEKLRIEHAQANEILNEVQARYYRVGGEIARVEDAIQHHKALRNRQHQDLDEIERAREAADNELDRERRRLEQLDSDIAAIKPALERANSGLTEHANERTAAEREMLDWQSRWEDVTSRAALPEQAAQVERARIEYLEGHITQLEERSGRLLEEQARFTEETSRELIEKLSTQVTQAQSRLVETRQALETVLASIERYREQDRRLAEHLDETRKHLQEVGGRLASLKVLQEAALGKHSRAVTEWLANTGYARAPRLAERIKAARGWERALETVLGSTLEAVCCSDGMECAIEALDALKEGRLHLLDTGASAPPSSPVTETSADTLLSKATAPRALHDLLARIYTAADLPRALALRSRLDAGESVVTANGVWLGRDWLRVTREADEHSGVLARELEIDGLREKSATLDRSAQDAQTDAAQVQARLRQLEHTREQLQGQLNEAHRAQAHFESRLSQQRHVLQQMIEREARIGAELQDVQGQLEGDRAALKHSAQARARASDAINALAAERALLNERRTAIQEILEQARAQAERAREQAHGLALRLEALSAARDAAGQGLERMRIQRDQLEQRRLESRARLELGVEPLSRLEQEMAELSSGRVTAEEALTSARASVQETETALRGLDSQRLETQQRTQALREELDVERMAWGEATVRLETLKEQFEETDFALAAVLDELALLADDDATVEHWQAQVENLGNRIARLGPINLAAIDECRDRCERKGYLDRQHADLTEALEMLGSAIHKIDRETRQRFKEIFEHVNARLKQTFPRLFGGGQAYLEMTGEDWLAAGVAIMARPPGKRVSTIHLMSGGEKALTAVALVFAIFELNPAPFCLLDEVDAPLDEVNVGRFCELVKEMSQRVQFIFITHNKTTMEYADQLIGITMGEPGVSRLVSVDLDEAALMATG